MIKVLPQKDSTYCMLMKIDFSQDNEMTEFFRFKVELKKTINIKISYIETKSSACPIFMID